MLILFVANRIAARCEPPWPFPLRVLIFTRPSVSSISEEGAKQLAEAVQSPHCQLRNLNLVGTWGNVLAIDSLSLFKGAFLTTPMLDTTAATYLGDKGAVLLGKALESPNCKLSFLNLNGMLWKQFLVSVVCYRVCSFPHSRALITGKSNRQL